MVRFIFSALCLFIALQSSSQVVPPGLGKTPLGGWYALGLQEKVSENWSSSSYVGFARKSDPESINPWKQQAILILNQEFKYKFAQKWEANLALMYTTQQLYESVEPFELLDPAFKQEFRLYTRLSRSFDASFVKITPTWRQEFRKYYTPDFMNYSESFQVRTRFRLKFDFPLTEDKRHKIILFSEQLFATSRMLDNTKWTKFKYIDSRFSLYYSVLFPNDKVVLNLGYMNNLIGTKKPYGAHIFAIDLQLRNLFSKL